MSTPTPSTRRSPSVEEISRETFYTPTANTYVEATFSPISTVGYAKRLVSPIDEEEKVILTNLLRKQTLAVPMITHCEPSSPLMALYLAFREISWFIHINNEPPSYPSGAILTKNHILSTLHQLGALPMLLALESLPRRYSSNRDPLRPFCSNCFHIGHRWLLCPHRKCEYCKVWGPGHTNATCPVRRAHQQRRGNPATARDPFFSPGEPSVSPNARRQTSVSSASSHSRNNRQHHRNRRNMPPPIHPIPVRRADTPLPDSVTEPHDFDDDAIANMTGEPCGDDY